MTKLVNANLFRYNAHRWLNVKFKGIKPQFVDYVAKISEVAALNGFEFRVMKSGNIAFFNPQEREKSPYKYHELVMGYNSDGIGFFLRSRLFYDRFPSYWTGKWSWSWPLHYNRETGEYGFDSFEEMMNYFTNHKFPTYLSNK